MKLNELFGRRKVTPQTPVSQDQIAILRAKREESKLNAMKLEEQMKDLVKSSVGANSIQRQINATDYQLLQAKLEAEKLQIEKLCTAITQLQNADMTRRLYDSAKEMETLTNGLNVGELIILEEETQIRHQMMHEENEEYRLAMERSRTPIDSLVDNSAFNALVAQEQMLEMLTPVETGVNTAAEPEVSHT